MFNVKRVLEVHAPRPFEPVYAAEYKVAKGTRHYFIAASGRARGTLLKNLVACVIDQDTSDVFPGKLLVAGIHWIIGFALPAKANRKYHLLVGGTEADLKSMANLVATVEFIVPGPAKSHFGGIPIQFPQAGSTICPQFTAYGSLFNNTPTTGATMQILGSDPIDGTPVTTNVPPGVWMYQFINVPEASGYTFTVTDSPGPDTGENDGITVDSTACGVVVGPPPPPPPPP